MSDPYTPKNIRLEDIKVDTFTSPHSVIRLTHLPTSTVISNNDLTEKPQSVYKLIQLLIEELDNKVGIWK